MKNFPEIDVKAVIGRIRQLRQNHAGARGKALFAKELRLSASTYNYYERDRLPPVEILGRICALTGADWNWLLTGESCPMEKSKDKTNGEKTSKGSLPGHLLAKIEGVWKSDGATQAALTAFLDLLLQKKKAEDRGQKTEDREERSRLLPVLGCTAAGVVHFWSEAGGKLPGTAEIMELAEKFQQNPGRIVGEGYWGSTGAGDWGEYQEQPAHLLQISEAGPDGVCEFVEAGNLSEEHPDAFALRVDGQSMAPRICDGDLVIVSPSEPARNGGLAVIKLEDQIGVTCKMMRTEESKIHLIPINEQFEIKIYPREKLEWALRVLGRLRLHTRT